MHSQAVLMSSGDDAGSPNWETPETFFDTLSAMFGPFTLDAAATAKNSKCARYWTSKDNALTQSWKVYGAGQAGGATFCNPPYGKGLAAWVEKGAAEAAIQKVNVVMLLPARMDSRWFHNIVMPRANHVFFVKGRIKFKLPGKKNAATFPSIVVVFGGAHDLWSGRINNGPHFGVIEQKHNAGK